MRLFGGGTQVVPVPMDDDETELLREVATVHPGTLSSIPGDLVHLEGAPTIAGGKVYVGGGAAGVVCVELDKAVLNGKELDLAAISKLQDERWKELQKKYEEDKKKDPDFAIPPNEDMLHKPAPKKVWQ